MADRIPIQIRFDADVVDGLRGWPREVSMNTFVNAAVRDALIREASRTGDTGFETFGIDDGELDGLKLNEAFVLGFEYCRVQEIIDQKPLEKIEITVHEHNVDRLRKMIARRHREVTVARMDHGWAGLTISPQLDSECNHTI